MSALILVDSVMCDHVEFFGRKMKANTAVLMQSTIFNLHMIQNVSTKQVIE